MKAIFVFKESLGSYQEHPKPTDMSRYYAVVVPDDFSITGKQYDPETGEFVDVEAN